MEFERKALICFSLGIIQGRLGVNAKEARLILDQKLIEMNQPPMTKEELQYILDLTDEISITLMQMGVNRKESRNLAFSKKDTHYG